MDGPRLLGWCFTSLPQASQTHSIGVTPICILPSLLLCPSMTLFITLITSLLLSDFLLPPFAPFLPDISVLGTRTLGLDHG